MREILFRGKRIDNGEWVCGDLYHGLNNMIYINTVVQIDDKTKCNKQFLVQYKTIGQFTGLTDKNGVKIFEGDILLNEWGEVKYDDGAFRFSNKNCYMVLTQYMCEFRNIIGNIHDK